MKRIFLFVTLGVLLAASTFAISESLGSIYSFHLYFDNGKLSVDRDFQFKYDILEVPYEAPVLATGFPYRGEVMTFAGDTAAQFKFDPHGGSASFTTGKITVKAPYVSDAQRVVFYDPQNNAVLTVPVEASSFCNDDGFCNADRGEDYKTCSRDCRAVTLPEPSQTSTPVPGAGGSGSLVGIIYSVIGVSLLAGLWWFFKKRRSAPPTPPAAGFGMPTPPTPPTPGNNV